MKNNFYFMNLDKFFNVYNLFNIAITNKIVNCYILIFKVNRYMFVKPNFKHKNKSLRKLGVSTSQILTYKLVVDL